jgi:hypothetical protein
MEPYPDETLGLEDGFAAPEALAEDAAWSMPPLATWYRGHDALTVFLTRGPLSGDWRWRHLPTRANGQAAAIATSLRVGPSNAPTPRRSWPSSSASVCPTGWTDNPSGLSVRQER